MVDFHKAKIGASKHTIRFDDGPREEKVQLRRKGHGKIQFLIKEGVLSTSYRRKRDDIAHRDPWSIEPRLLVRALTLTEAQNMWESFDSEIGALLIKHILPEPEHFPDLKLVDALAEPEHQMWKSMDECVSHSDSTLYLQLQIITLYVRACRVTLSHEPI